MAISSIIEVEVRDETGYAVATVRGEVDVYSHPLLRECLRNAAERGADSLIVDASGIEFIDSSGLGVLVGAYKRAVRRRGYLLIAAPTDRVAKMLTITGLTRVFIVVDGGVEDAIDELQRRIREQA